MATMPGSGWTVTGQTQGQEIADNGQLVRGFTVTYRTGNGVVGSVFIPAAQYTTDTVRAAISAQAALLDQVHGLNSGMGG